MELKLGDALLAETAEGRSNRTFMELKCHTTAQL